RLVHPASIQAPIGKGRLSNLIPQALHYERINPQSPPMALVGFCPLSLVIDYCSFSGHWSLVIPSALRLHLIIRRRHRRIPIAEAQAPMPLVGIELEVAYAVGGDFQGVLQRDDRAADRRVRAA